MKMILTNKSLKRISALGVALTTSGAILAVIAAFNPDINVLSVTAATVAMIGSVLSIAATEAIQSRVELRIARINAVATAANLKAAELTTRSQELQLQIENERTKRLLLERKSGPRILSQAEASIITETLRQIKGRAKIHIFRRQDQETKAYSEQIIQAIIQAGVDVTISDIGHFIRAGVGIPQYGVSVTIGLGNGSIETSIAFKSCGIEATIQKPEYKGLEQGAKYLVDPRTIAASIDILEKKPYV